MDQRTFHSELSAQDLADALLAKFNQDAMRAQQRGRGKKIVVQIGTSRAHPDSQHTLSSAAPCATGL